MRRATQPGEFQAPANDFKEIREPRRYVLRYRPAVEPATMRALRHLRIEYVHPTFQHRLPRSRGIVERPWFRGYVFLTMDALRDRWHGILRAPGVIGFLGDPTPLNEGVYQDMIARCPSGLMPQHALTVIPAGSEVEILEGALKGQIAVVCDSRQHVVIVEVMAFGRPTRALLHTKQVRVK